MLNLGSNQILLLTVLLLVCGVGTYVTYVRQQSTLETLAERVQTRQEKKTQIETLRADRAENRNRLAATRTRWRNRYKKVPDTIASTDVVAYLTELTQRGFRTFDVASAGPTLRDGYSTYRFDIEGKAYFSSLYRLIWRLENGRPFYRIQDLRLSYLEKRTTDPEEGAPSLDVLVSFEMAVEAVYGIVKDVPRPLQEPPADEALPVAQNEAQPPVPSSVMPDPDPSINPFYPLIFDEVPPNEERRLNVETAELVSIVDEQAVFATERGVKRVSEGDRVYLGTIIDVDPSAGRVVARLNRGGIVKRVERLLRSERTSREPPSDSEPR